MNIRKATYTDLNKIIPMFKEFANENMERYGFDFDIGRATFVLTHCIEKHMVIVVELDEKIVAALAGVIVNPTINNSKLFQEVFFYAYEDYRRYSTVLLNHVTRFCKQANIDKIVMANPSLDPKMDRFYRMNGYVLLEKQYIKEVN